MTSFLMIMTSFPMMMMLAEKSTGEVELKTLGAELTRRQKSIVNYVPPSSRMTYSSGESVAENLARQKWEESSEKFYELAQKIHKAHPKEFKAWGPLAEQLGEVSEAIQQRHAQEWEQMIIALREMITLEREAYIKELERKVKKYEEEEKQRREEETTLFKLWTAHGKPKRKANRDY